MLVAAASSFLHARPPAPEAGHDPEVDARVSALATFLTGSVWSSGERLAIHGTRRGETVRKVNFIGLKPQKYKEEKDR